MAKDQKKKQTRPTTSFGAVSRINTAPVAIGNSVRGSKPVIKQSANGANVHGRDFAFSLSSTVAAITDWELIGGSPITPCAFPSTVLRNYCQMFSEFKVNKLILHYITSSPTSQAGDILVYYQPQRLEPMMDYSSNSFLPYTLSDNSTIIGPQWTNHSTSLNIGHGWHSTNYGANPDLNEDADGAVYVFSKTNSANSPGYILFDYDITFRNLKLNPRMGVLPVARAQVNFAVLKAPTATVAANSALFTIDTLKTISGAISSAPTGFLRGDIYKVTVQATVSTTLTGNPVYSAVTTAPTLANSLQYADDTAIVVDDGSTFYANFINDTQCRIFSTVDAARATSAPIEWALTNASVNVFQLCAAIELVTNIDDFQQSSYPG
jgi:hypothetical protein